MDTKELPKKQRIAYEQIRDLTNQLGASPSYEEIRLKLRLSSLSSIHRYLNILQRKGFLKLGEGKARSIKLLKPSDVPLDKQSGIPIRGIWKSDRCKFVAEEEGKTTTIPFGAFKSPVDFFIEAKVTSALPKKGMFFGDLLAVQCTNKFQPKEVVAVNADDRILVGIGNHRGKVRLLDLDCGGVVKSPYTIKKGDEILGIVIGVFRQGVTSKRRVNTREFVPTERASR